MHKDYNKANCIKVVKTKTTKNEKPRVHLQDYFTSKAAYNVLFISNIIFH